MKFSMPNVFLDSRMKEVLIKSLVVAISVVLMYPIHKIILTSVVFSYAVFPFKKGLKRYLKSSTLSAAICTILSVSIILYFVIFLLNVGFNGIADLYNAVQTESFKATFDNFREVMESNTVGRLLVEQIDIKTVLSFFASNISHALVLAPGVLIQIFAVLIFSFYLLRDGDKFVHIFVKQFSKSNQRVIRRFLRRIDNVFRSIVYGYILTAVIIGLLVLSSFSLLGAPQPFVLGLLAIIFSIVPLFGPTVPSVIAFLYFIYNGLYIKAVLIVVLWAALSFVDDLIRAVISSTGVREEHKPHPLLFIIGLISGQAMFGFIGLIIGPMIFGMLSVLINVYSERE